MLSFSEISKKCDDKKQHAQPRMITDGIAHRAKGGFHEKLMESELRSEPVSTI
jgi:hypothetical protein